MQPSKAGRFKAESLTTHISSKFFWSCERMFHSPSPPPIFYIVYCATLKLIFGGVSALVSGLRMEDINNIIENVPKNNGNIKNTLDEIIIFKYLVSIYLSTYL